MSVDLLRFHPQSISFPRVLSVDLLLSPGSEFITLICLPVVKKRGYYCCVKSVLTVLARNSKQD